MNRIECKSHRIGTYEINKILFSYFHDKILYPQSNGYYGLALAYYIKYSTEDYTLRRLVLEN